MLTAVTRAPFRNPSPRALRPALRDAPPALIGFGAVFGLAARNGGFFATTWGWWALTLLLLAVAALVVREAPALGRLQALMLLLLTALVAWTALSALWSTGAGTPLLEAERSALYLGALAAVALSCRQSSPRPLAAGVLAACLGISAWALEVRLDSAGSPTEFMGFRLAGRVGYTNGLGLLAALGSLLAVGFALHSSRASWRAAASASLVIFLPTLTFTFSRGSWLALAAGLIALVALEPERLRLLPRLAATIPAPLLAAWLSGRSSALTTLGAPTSDVLRQGHRLGLALLGLIAVAAGLALVADRFPAPRVDRRVARLAAAALAAVALAVAALAVARVGGPEAAVHRALASFRSVDSNTGSSHVFSAGGSFRSDYWSVAWQEVRAHPLLGGGAGSFGRWWLQRRPINYGGLDAHTLYLETLAELGPVGLLLLAGALATPLLALRRARVVPLGPACSAAYIALLLHAAADWDWELPAVTLAGLLCGAALLATEPPRATFGLRARAAGVALAAVMSAFVFVMHVGNVRLAASESARARGDVGTAVRTARQAEQWQPWSSQPPLLLGKSQLAAGDLDGAAASFRTAIRRDPGDWEGWYQLGLATSGRERAAAFDRASRLDPIDSSFAAPAKRT